MSKVDKKQQILDTALELFVEQGFYATSTASIAKKAGVATGTLFHHFPSKVELMNQLFLNIKQEFADDLQAQLKLSGQLKNDAKSLWFNAINWAMEQPLKQHFFQQYSMSPTIDIKIREQAMEGILGFLGQLIAQGQQQQLLADYPHRMMIDNCHGQYLTATRYFLDNPMLWQQESHREASFNLFWQAMAKV